MPDLFLELRDEEEAPGQTPAPLPEVDALALLQTAEFTASTLIPWGSNYSFAVALEAPNGRNQLAIYKPRDGETPLYDFPNGTLYQRECAAYIFSRFLGWDIVPPTLIRDGPHGVGSVQLYVEPATETEESQRFWGSCQPEIERLVLFDHLTNNADRKIGHCLRDRFGKVWGIDHGLTFNHLPKLRTVLWQYMGEPIAPPLLADLQRLAQRPAEIRRELQPHLDPIEIDALLGRAVRLAELGAYPSLNPRRNIPYGWW